MKCSFRPVIIGPFGPPTLTCIRSWGEHGFPVGMVCIGSEREIPALSMYLSNYVKLHRRKLYTEEGINIINEFLIIFKADVVTCIAENIACWLNDNRHLFPGKVKVCLPKNKTIKDVLSKKKQIEIAQRVGMQILPTYLIDQDPNNAKIIKSEHFPICLRPSEPQKVTPPFKVKIIYSQKELVKHLQSFKVIREPIIGQPFLSLPNLVVHGARTQSGSTIGMQAFLVERKFEGVTLTIRPITLNEELREKCIAFTDAFGLTGNYHFEFLIDPQTRETFFLEKNTRLGGTTAKIFACGYDEPMYALQAYGIECNFKRKLRNITVSSKQALLKYFFYTLTDRLTSLDYPDEPKHLRILKTLWGLLFYRDDVVSIKDLKGTTALYLGNLMAKFRQFMVQGF